MDGHREETSEFAALSGYTCDDETYFVGIEATFIVCHSARYITQTDRYV